MSRENPTPFWMKRPNEFQMSPEVKMDSGFYVLQVHLPLPLPTSPFVDLTLCTPKLGPLTDAISAADLRHIISIGDESPVVLLPHPQRTVPSSEYPPFFRSVTEALHLHPHQVYNPLYIAANLTTPTRLPQSDIELSLITELLFPNARGTVIRYQNGVQKTIPYKNISSISIDESLFTGPDAYHQMIENLSISLKKALKIPYHDTAAERLERHDDSVEKIAIALADRRRFDRRRNDPPPTASQRTGDRRTPINV